MERFRHVFCSIQEEQFELMNDRDRKSEQQIDLDEFENRNVEVSRCLTSIPSKTTKSIGNFFDKNRFTSEKP